MKQFRDQNIIAVIFKDLIPLSADARTFNEALFMGEDFELLFTISSGEAKRLINSRQGSLFSPIGKVVNKTQGLALLDKHAREIKLKFKGFQHFCRHT